MGDILSKLGQVCDKIGVTERAHTIEEQIDLISESLDKIPASTNIAEALDDLSEVAQNINNEEVYVDKTITANGEYLPAQDDATAYSKVTVNVAPGFNVCCARIYDSSSTYSYIAMMRSESGNYSTSDLYTTQTTPSDWEYHTFVCLDPVNSFEGLGNIERFNIAFTPGPNCNFTGDGDAIVPNDGKLYFYRKYRDAITSELVYYISKTDQSFNESYSIT